MFKMGFFLAYVVLTIALLYLPLLALYRLYFHPLAKFPGPKLAAITRYFEAYYDVIRGGQYTFKISELHQKYGKLQFCRSFETARLTSNMPDHPHKSARTSC